MPFLQKVTARQQKKFMLKIQVAGEENAMFCGGANHFKNGEGVGGKMVLFQDSLVFKSHKFNIQNHELHIPLSDIAAVSAYNVWGIVPTGLEVIKKAGGSEKFVVEKPGEWVEEILLAKTLAA